MPATWSEVDQTVLDLAQEIIHLHHKDLQEARIGFLFRSEASTSQGKTVWAHAEKVSAKFGPLLDLHFLIWIAEDIWTRIDSQKRRALIDHELCHCEMVGDPKMRAHDIEEFQCIIERYGFWNVDLYRLKPAFEEAIQLDLGLPKSERPGPVAVDPASIGLKPKGRDPHTITLNMDRRCARCGVKGVTQTGYCLDCEVSLKIEGNLEKALELMLEDKPDSALAGCEVSVNGRVLHQAETITDALEEVNAE